MIRYSLLNLLSRKYIRKWCGFILNQIRWNLINYQVTLCGCNFKISWQVAKYARVLNYFKVINKILKTDVFWYSNVDALGPRDFEFRWKDVPPTRCGVKIEWIIRTVPCNRKLEDETLFEQWHSDVYETHFESKCWIRSNRESHRAFHFAREFLDEKFPSALESMVILSSYSGPSRNNGIFLSIYLFLALFRWKLVQLFSSYIHVFYLSHFLSNIDP